MPLFGIVRGGSGVAAIVTSGQYDARFCVSTNWGKERQYAIDPGFTLRTFPKNRDWPMTWPWNITSWAARRPIGWLWGSATGSTISNAAASGRFANCAPTRPNWPTRRRPSRCGFAWESSRYPYKIAEQTADTEPPMRVFCDFRRLRDILDECHRQGIGRAEFCLVGWNRGGHDGRYPQIFPSSRHWAARRSFAPRSLAHVARLPDRRP